jgi:orotate phosphoribosyltransferase
LVHERIRTEAAARKLRVDAIGGLTMGADPVALATAMYSYRANEAEALQTFSVRKTPKGHGQTRLIEGNFKKGDCVVVVDDVVTRGDSTITALNAVVNEGGKVAFVVVLVDRQEGGRAKIEATGCPVFSIFEREELLQT